MKEISEFKPVKLRFKKLNFCCILLVQMGWVNMHSHLWHTRLNGLVSSVFTYGSGDLGSVQGCVILKTLKMVLDTSLLNTQQYKVRIKGKVEQSRERSSALP